MTDQQGIGGAGSKQTLADLRQQRLGSVIGNGLRARHGVEFEGVQARQVGDICRGHLAPADLIHRLAVGILKQQDLRQGRGRIETAGNLDAAFLVGQLRRCGGQIAGRHVTIEHTGQQGQTGMVIGVHLDQSTGRQGLGDGLFSNAGGKPRGPFKRREANIGFAFAGVLDRDAATGEQGVGIDRGGLECSLVGIGHDTDLGAAALAQQSAVVTAIEGGQLGDGLFAMRGQPAGGHIPFRPGLRRIDRRQGQHLRRRAHAVAHDDDHAFQCHILRACESRHRQAKTENSRRKARFEHGSPLRNDFHRLLRRAHDRLTTACPSTHAQQKGGKYHLSAFRTLISGAGIAV